MIPINKNHSYNSLWLLNRRHNLNRTLEQGQHSLLRHFSHGDKGLARCSWYLLALCKAGAPASVCVMAGLYGARLVRRLVCQIMNEPAASW